MQDRYQLQNALPREHLRHSPSEYIVLLKDACAAFNINRGRGSKYLELIRGFYERGAQDAEHQLAYFEVSELIDLHYFWGRYLDEFPGLRSRISRVMRKGPVLREQENPQETTNRPRNDAFSILMAGMLLDSGANVVAAEGIPRRDFLSHLDADSTILQNERYVDLQCKRPQTLRAVESRFQDAVEQIRGCGRPGQIGVVALDCSTAIRPPLGDLVRESQVDAYEWIQRYLVERIAPRLAEELRPEILGYVLFARVPARIEERSLLLNSSGHPLDYVHRYSIRVVIAVVNSASLDQRAGNQLLRQWEDWPRATDNAKCHLRPGKKATVRAVREKEGVEAAVAMARMLARAGQT